MASILGKRSREDGSSNDNNLEVNAKKKKTEQYSNFSLKMMKSMGYTPGKGIGKYSTGIAEPISESIHKGRRGLGFTLEGLEKEDVEWELEEVSCEQAPEWLVPSDRPVLTIDDLCGWIHADGKKDSIEDETEFCDPDILKKILAGKTVFDHLSEKEFLEARLRSNPFESIKGAIFQNRAAMKMANIDAVFDFMFSEKVMQQKDRPHELFYFADICAGPGGFSEYILWKFKWHAKGFGFTLKDPESGSDFKLENFLAAPSETFDPHYGVGGYDGDGDVTRTENVEAFQNYVMEGTGNQGVHFVMADGGISVEGQENIQEILTKQLVLCQYMCALSVLRTGGHFVCKVFDMFTPFSVGLFYLLYRCFERVCLFKPVTSRPANSERYIICQKLHLGTEAVQEYLKAINYKLNELKKESSELDILEVVPLEILKSEEMFATYVTAFNDSFGVNQVINLKKLQYYVKNSDLLDRRQSEIRKTCLKLWKVPNIPRTGGSDVSAISIFKSSFDKLQPKLQLKSLDSDSFGTVEIDSMDFMKKDFHSWKWMWAFGKRQMLVSLGTSGVYAWDMKGNAAIFQRTAYHLELPSETILEVEVVDELTGEGSGQKKLTVIYIIDVIAVYGERVDDKVFKERQEYAKKLASAVNKPCRKTLTMLKSKTFFRVTDVENELSKLKLKDCKGQRKPIPTIQVNTQQEVETVVAPKGLIFFRSTKDPWHIHLSKKSKMFYYYNSRTNQSTFECPKGSCASYSDQVISRRKWLWIPSMYSSLCTVVSGTEDPNTYQNNIGLCFRNLLET